MTAQFDAESDRRLEALRRRHFPVAINRVGAHLTLFHNLHCGAEAALAAAAEVSLMAPPFAVEVKGPMRLGRGVALAVESDALMRLRRALAERLKAGLLGQDRERFRPHVTIQNKVAPHEAAGLFDHLAATFAPFRAVVEGIQLWRYQRAAWAPIAAIPLQAKVAG